MKSITPAAVLTGAILLAAGCNRAGQPVIPTAPTSGASGAAQVVDLAIAGNGSLTAIGETSQLTAKLTLGDGAIKDATRAVGWLSIDPSTIAISPSGLVMALRYGVSDIEATYESKAAWIRVTATPSGTFVVYGRVREPGYGFLDGVSVSAGVTVLGVTRSGGEFSFGGLRQDVVLSFQKDGFEPRSVPATPGRYMDVVMQRVVQVSSGARVDVFATSTAYTCVAPCMFDRNTIHF